MPCFSPRNSTLAVAATAMALGAGASATAGGYHGHHSYYYGHHGHHGHYGYHGHGGGKAAAIALGVIGGAIILNELAEEKARQRYYEDRYYERRARYDRYALRSVPVYDEDYDEDFGPDADDQELRDGDLGDDDLDARLEGGRDDGGPEPIRLSYGRAYDACLRHARAALGDRGFVLAAPHQPETAEDLGRAWKMTATVIAERGGDSWSRAMYCEADDARVYLIELI